MAFAALAILAFAGQPVTASAATIDLSPRIPAGAEASTPPGTTVTVKPGTDAAWLTSTIDGGSLTGAISTYASAPTGGPAGPGAFRHRLATGSDSATWSSSLFAGQRLDTLTELRYSTFVTLGSNAPSLRLQLDLNGDGLFQGASVDEELVFEPIYQTGGYPGDSFANQCSGIPGCVAKGQWQTWDARGGGWYSRKLGDSGPPLRTLASWAAQYPTAQIANGAALFFKSGSGWANTNAFFDALRVNGVTYDFEPLTIEITPDSEALFPRFTYNGTSNLEAPRTADGALQQYSAAIEPLSGRGSLHQKVKVLGDRVYVYAEPAGGIALNDLSGLSYATYLRNHGTKDQAPFMSIYLDLDGDGLYDDTLQLIPQFQTGTGQCPASKCVQSDTWQVWDGLSSRWFSRNDYLANNQTFRRLDEWAAQPGFENARIAMGNAVTVQVGSGYSNVDAFVDYININGTTYDFETQVVTVSPQQMNGWFTTPVAGSGGDQRRQEFVNGPANAPFGVGSLNQQIDASSSNGDDDVFIMTPLLAGQPIESITELSYRARVDSTPAGQAPIVKVMVDYDGENYYTTQGTDRLIIFEPAYQDGSWFTAPQYGAGYPYPLPDQCDGPCIKKGEWKNWDVLGGGVYFGGQISGGMHPWDELIDQIRSEPLPPGMAENFSRGRIAFGERPISIESDNIFGPNYDASIDSITINGVTFDFEAAVPEAQLDGERTQDEPYRLMVNDTEAPSNNPLDVAVYGACTSDSLYFSFESLTPGHNLYPSKLFFDANNNDTYNGRGQDRMISFYPDGTIVEGGTGPGEGPAVPIPGAQVKFRADSKAAEIRLPKAYFGEAWFAYDIWSDNSGRNTSWDSFNYSQMKSFIPSPCLPIPEEVFGATPIDCSLYDTDIRLIQYVIDRSASTRLKLFGTCDLSQAAAHGGTTASINSAAIVVDRDGLTIESLDITRRALIAGSGTQTAFYVAPGTKDVTIRGLEFTNLSRPIVVQNSIRTTIGARTPLEPLSPLGNRMFGIGAMQEGVLALASTNAGTSTTITHGANGLLSRTYATPVSGDAVGIPGPDGQDLVDITIAGNYISYRPPGPLTPNSDVTGIVVRQRGSARDIYGVDVSQNAVGMASSEFPNFNYAGIRIHADSNDPNFAHIRDVTVFKNTLGRFEELNLTRVDSNLPDAGDLQATGRVGIALGRLADFEVKGNSIRTILSKVPGINMMGGGIVVYDSFDGSIETNSVITIAGPDTKAADLGAIGIVDNLMDLFSTTSAPGKPTRDIKVIANYTGWSGNDPSDFGAQRGLLVSGASGIDATLNQFKTIGDKSILLGTAISGPGTAFGWPATLGPQRVAQSNFCRNWLNIHRGQPGSENPADTPASQIQWNASGLGSTGNNFPNGQFQTGNHNCI